MENPAGAEIATRPPHSEEDCHIRHMTHRYWCQEIRFMDFAITRGVGVPVVPSSEGTTAERKMKA